MKKTALASFLWAIVPALLLFNSCNLSPLNLQPITIPILPAGLTNSENDIGSESRLITHSREGNTNLTEYGEFVVVPEIANNYNLLVKVVIPFIEELNEFNSSVDGWVEIKDNPYFQKEFRPIPSGEISNGTQIVEHTVPVIYRTNIEKTIFELYFFNPNGETRILTVEKLKDFTHALLLMHNTSGNKGCHDSVEIIQSEATTLTKCIRIHETNEGKLYQLFVSNTDRTTDFNNTIGSRKYGTFAENENITYELDHTQVEDSGEGYFNDIEKRIHQTEENFHAYDFPDYKSLTKYMFSNGLSIEAIDKMSFESYEDAKQINEYEAAGSIQIFKASSWDKEALQELSVL